MSVPVFLDLDSDGTAELVLRLRYPTSGVSDQTIGEVYSFPGLDRRLSLPLQIRHQLDKNPVVEEAVLRREVQPASMLLRVLSYQSDACKTVPCEAFVSDGWVRYAWGGPAAVRAIRLPKYAPEEVLGWSDLAVDVTAFVGLTGVMKPNRGFNYKDSADNQLPPLPPTSWMQQAVDPAAVFRLFSATNARFRPVDFVRKRETPVDKSPTRRKRRIPKNVMTQEDVVVHDAYDLLVLLAPQDLRLRELVVYQTVESSEWIWSREGRELSLPIPAGLQVVPADLSGGSVKEVGSEYLWISVPLRQVNSNAKATHVYVVDAKTYRLLWQRRLSSDPTPSGPACTARAFRIDVAKRGHQLFEWEETCGSQRQSTWWVQKERGAPFQEVPQPILDPVPVEKLRTDGIWPEEGL